MDYNAYVIIPQYLFVEHENLLVVRTTKQASIIQTRTTVPVLSNATVDERHDQVVYRSDGTYGADILYTPSVLPFTYNILEVIITFTIHFCPDKSCESIVRRNISTGAAVMRREVVIVGETERRVYGAAETVKFRFIPLSPYFFIPLLKPINYPKRKIAYDQNGEPHLKQVTMEEVANITRTVFDKIEVFDSRGKVVHRWSNIMPRTALNMTYTLPSRAASGKWMIVARVRFELKLVTFSVMSRSQPGYIITIHLPNYDVTYDTISIPITVCVSHEDQSPVYGKVDVNVCVCGLYEEEPIFMDNKKSTVGQMRCRKSAPSYLPRPCAHVRTFLTSTGCSSWNVSTAPLKYTDPAYPIWRQKLVVCVRLTEINTNKSIQYCKTGGEVYWKTPNIQLELPYEYDFGLPIQGALHFEHPTNSSGTSIEIVAHELNECDDAPSITRNSYHQILSVHTDKNGRANFVLEPIVSNNRIKVTATYPAKGHSRWRYTGLWPPRPDDSYASSFTILHPRRNHPSVTMKMWPSDKSAHYTCSGKVILEVIANTPLTDKLMYIHTVVRGKAIQKRIQVTDIREAPCRGQDGALGHYTCMPANKNVIQCLPCWMGPDCLQPICASNCHHERGYCGKPYQCECLPRWAGENCNVCKVQNVSLCQRNGEELLDSTSKEDRTVHSVSDQEIGNDSAPEGRRPVLSFRTLYQATITIDISSDWRPTFSGVVYFEHGEQGTFLVSMPISMTGHSDCPSSPSNTQSDAERKRLRFDRHIASPGENLQLTVYPEGTNSTAAEGLYQDIDQVCFIKVTPVTSNELSQATTFSTSVTQYPTWNRAIKTSDYFSRAGLIHLSTNDQNFTWKHNTTCLGDGMIDAPTFKSAATEQLPSVHSGILRDSVHISGRTEHRETDSRSDSWILASLPIEAFRQPNGTSLYGSRINLSAPGVATIWRSSALCTTRGNGVWVSERSYLTVQPPVLANLTLPSRIKRGEVIRSSLYLAISMGEPGCVAVHVSNDNNETEWKLFGPNVFTGCLAAGENVTIPVRFAALRIGTLNYTIRVRAVRVTFECGKIHEAQSRNMHHFVFHLLVSRTVQVDPEGVASNSKVNEVICPHSSDKVSKRMSLLYIPRITVPQSTSIRLFYSTDLATLSLRSIDPPRKLSTLSWRDVPPLLATSLYALDLSHSSSSHPYASKISYLKHCARSQIASVSQWILEKCFVNGSKIPGCTVPDQTNAWLTATILRTLAKISKIEPNLLIDWKALKNRLVEHLASFINDRGYDGCFTNSVESRKMEQHNSSVNDALGHIAYILLALWEARNTKFGQESATLRRMITDGWRCYKNQIESDQDMQESYLPISTYNLAIFAYTLTLVEPSESLTKLLQAGLMSRRRSFLSPEAGVYSFWSAIHGPLEWSAESAAAADIEATSFAYLTMRQTNVSLTELTSIFRWLVTHQDSSGWFSSMKSTVFGLEVLADYMKQLRQIEADRKPINASVSVRINSIKYTHFDWLTEYTPGTFKHLVTHLSEVPEWLGIEWTLDGNLSQTVSCLFLQTAVSFHLPEQNTSSGLPYSITVNTRQHEGYVPGKRRLAHVDICIVVNSDPGKYTFPKLFLTEVYVVTGWIPVRQTLLQLVSDKPDGAREVVIDSERLVVTLYFDGFTAEEANMTGDWMHVKRCFSIQMEQIFIVHNAKPGVVRVLGESEPNSFVSVTYSLDVSGMSDRVDECTGNTSRPYNSEMGPNSEEYTQNGTCPICTLTGGTYKVLLRLIFSSLCMSCSDNILILRINREHHGLVDGTASMITRYGFVASLNGTFSLPVSSYCNCTQNNDTTGYVLVAPHAWETDPTKLAEQVSLSHSVMYMLSFKQFSSILSAIVKQFLDSKTSVKGCFGWSTCKHLLAAYRHIMKHEMW